MYRAASVLALALLACAPDYETERLRITTHFDFPLCEGNLDSYERMIDRLEAQTGRTLRAPLDVDLWRSSDWREDGYSCGRDGVLGCYNSVSHRVFTSLTPLVINHEIAHAVTTRPPVPDFLIYEGVAEALSSPTLFLSTKPESARRSEDVDYGVASHFIRWLHETRGGDCVRALVSSSRADMPATFASHCGSSLDDAISEYSTSAPWTYPPPFGCTFDSVASHDLDAAPLEFTAELDCASPDTTSTEAGMLTNHTLRVASAGHYLVYTDATAISLRRCITDPEPLAEPFTLADDGIPPATILPFRIFRGGQFNTIRLDPGDHLLGISTNTWTGTHEFTVRIEPAPPIARIP